jgi:hypothetical protein
VVLIVGRLGGLVGGKFVSGFVGEVWFGRYVVGCGSGCGEVVGGDLWLPSWVIMCELTCD